MFGKHSIFELCSQSFLDFIVGILFIYEHNAMVYAWRSEDNSGVVSPFPHSHEFWGSNSGMHGKHLYPWTFLLTLPHLPPFF